MLLDTDLIRFVTKYFIQIEILILNRIKILYITYLLHLTGKLV